MEKLTEEENTLLISALFIINRRAKESFANVITETKLEETDKRYQAEREFKERRELVHSIFNKLKQIQ